MINEKIYPGLSSDCLLTALYLVAITAAFET